MLKNIYHYEDYKTYLLELMASYPKGGRGLRQQLAQAMRCQVSYVTQVLAGPSHFSQEQLWAACRFFALPEEESLYLLTLLGFNRAATQELRAALNQQLRAFRDKGQLLKTRLKIKKTLSRDEQSIYYSSWHYSAVHMSLTIPTLRNKTAIARRLNLSLKRVSEVIHFLHTSGLVKKEKNFLTTDAPLMHLEHNSPLLGKHHLNWRLKAMQRFEEEPADGLHYSVVFSVSEKDMPALRERLAKCLEDCAQLIKPSKEEELAAINLDFFRL